MNEAVSGALVGLGIAAFLVAGDYLMVRQRAAERAKRQHKTVAVLDQTERKQMRSLFRFVIWLPAAFALVSWAIWG